MAKDYSLEKRKYVIGGFITVIVIIFIIRLFNLQVSDATYKENAESNAFFRKVLYPSRGLIYDRNGRLVVLNQPEYDVMLIPKDLGNHFDTLGLCEVLNISKEELMAKWADMKNPRKKPGYSAYTPQKLM